MTLKRSRCEQSALTLQHTPASRQHPGCLAALSRVTGLLRHQDILLETRSDCRRRTQQTKQVASQQVWGNMVFKRQFYTFSIYHLNQTGGHLDLLCWFTSFSFHKKLPALGMQNYF